MLIKAVPYSKQNINSKDIRSVKKVLKSEYLTTGPEVKKFENVISKFVKSKYSISTNSATSALHIACLSFGLKKKDIVWTSSISFVASANCAKYCGSSVDFLDINNETFNIDIDKLKKKLIKAKKNNKLPKILIPVHLAGSPCDMKSIYNLSKKYKFKIIEDASHAIGSKYLNTNIGSCKYSDITIFSFHPVKMITTCEGGVATTNNLKIYKKLKIFREHGIVREKKNFIFSSKIDTHYEQQYLGYNYRLSDVHAALGTSQLKRLKKFIKIRNKIKNTYLRELKNYPIKFQKILPNTTCSYHLLLVNVNKKLRNKFFLYLRNKNIKTNIHYIPIFFHPYYYKKKFLENRNSINYYYSTLSLPIFYGLKPKTLNYIIKSIKDFFSLKYVRQIYKIK